MYYQVNVKSQYYVTPGNNLYSDSINLVSPNLGEIMLGVHAYSLKLSVAESFHYEPTAKTMERGKNAGPLKNYLGVLNRPKAGIPIILYRKNKNNVIPPVEGKLTAPMAADKNGIEQVASGLTVVEPQSDSTQKSYVTFDKLLCNIYSGDEYYILAVDSAQYSKDAAAGKKVFALTPYTDQHYKASEKAFSYNNTSILYKSNLYTSTTGTYSIESTLPPEATVTGQIVYEWAADPTKTRRPLGNKSFTIRIASANSPLNGHQDKGPAYNSDPIRGVGKTDSLGRFTANLVVMNVANYGDKLPNGATIDNPYSDKNR